METKSQTLFELKENDKVIFSSRNSKEVKIIKRVTPTQIIVECENYVGTAYERKFRKDNGYEIKSDSYYLPKIKIYTEEEMTLYYKEKRRKKLISIGLNVSDLDTSEEVFEFLKSKNLI